MLVPTSVEGQRTTAIPELESYPVFPDSASLARAAEGMGLRLGVLEAPWTGLNWYEKYQGRVFKRFVYETLERGTPVYYDAQGVVRYKADCGNRLVTRIDCPQCPFYEPREAEMWVGQFEVFVSGGISVLHTADQDLLDALATRQSIQVNLPPEKGGWSRRTKLLVGGAASAVLIGAGYCAIEKCWSNRTSIRIRVGPAG